MKIVLVSLCSLQNRYFIRRVCDAYPETIVVRSTKRYRRLGSPKGHTASGAEPLAQRLRKTLRRYVSGIRSRLLARKLLTEGESPSISDPTEIPSTELSSRETAEKLRKLNPDVVLVFAAPILKPNILSVARLCTVNVHLGIPPEYRGNHALFWALYRRDFDNVGACLHHIDQGVDTGNVLVEVFPALNRRSGELDAEAGAIRLIASATVEFLRYLEENEETPSGKPQGKKGRNYKAAERGVFTSLVYVLQRALFLGQPIPRRDRIVKHYP